MSSNFCHVVIVLTLLWPNPVTLETAQKVQGKFLLLISTVIYHPNLKIKKLFRMSLTRARL